jgi:endonuclease YncB( thermonuclease family)
MFRRLIITIILVGLSAGIAQANNCPIRSHLTSVRTQLGKKCDHTKNRFNCLDVIKVTDGDTISVNIPGVHAYFGENTFVRLSGLDTPEKRPPRVKCIPTIAADSRVDQLEYQKCLEAEKLRQCEVDASDEASEILQETICEKGDRVDVEMAVDTRGNLYREKYGRVLGNVYVTSQINGRQKVLDVKKLLLKGKLAFEYDGGKKPSRNWCNKKLITDPKLKIDYVKANFCSSRKCTEKTLQLRCYHRSGYMDQKDCYVHRIEKNIKTWFRVCSTKTGQERKNCYSEKTVSYTNFCRQYDSRSKSQMCRQDLSQPIEDYCKTLPSGAQDDCLVSL